MSGWASAAHLFACNRYRLGAGTINNPDWKIGDAKKVYVTRALTAIASQWDIHRDESNYFQDYVGAGSQDFSNHHKYGLRLPSAPLVNLFWSLNLNDARISTWSLTQSTDIQSGARQPA